MQEEKKGISMKLPKLGKASQFILLIGIFVIVFFVLFTLTNAEKEKSLTLQNDLTNLKVAASEGTLEAEASTIQNSIAFEQQRYNTLLAEFPEAGNSVGVFDDILLLADSYNLDVTSISFTDVEAIKDETGGTYLFPGQVYSVGLSGEAARMQSFFLGLSKFPTASIDSLSITPSGTESNMDIGAVNIRFYFRERN